MVMARVEVFQTPLSRESAGVEIIAGNMVGDVDFMEHHEYYEGGENVRIVKETGKGSERTSRGSQEGEAG